MNNGELAIDVKGLIKKFGNATVVKGIDLRVKKGAIFGFLGPNGSGKTTTIRMLCGLLTPDGGSGQCLDLDVVTQSREIKKQCGYMTQKFSLYGDLSIEENLDFVAVVYGMDNRKELVQKALQDLGLYDRRKHLVDTLSGGWKQRVALSCATLHNPKLLLLDEPTAGVDPKARREFWDHVHELSLHGITTLVATHYMDEAERCTDLAYIAYGDILARGTPQQIVNDAKLFTWKITGENIQSHIQPLRALPYLDQVGSFGDELHVSGYDHDKIIQNLQPYALQHQLQLEEIPPRLEDVFIALIKNEPEEVTDE
ncbi:MAG: export transporter ATP-binding protein [Gammaproteobacteria bacterium]|jgi:ABC-2 type transport system ATP-binding protein|nr:export transporter ATP-binding protein [Gammaproteobacteria bacterium]